LYRFNQHNSFTASVSFASSSGFQMRGGAREVATLASLLFGGSATAVTTRSEAMNYYSEPNQIASRIQALYGMVSAILRVTGKLRDAMLRDHIRTDD
jgi:hypothetical protein